MAARVDVEELSRALSRREPAAMSLAQTLMNEAAMGSEEAAAALRQLEALQLAAARGRGCARPDCHCPAGTVDCPGAPRSTAYGLPQEAAPGIIFGGKKT